MMTIPSSDGVPVRQMLTALDTLDQRWTIDDPVPVLRELSRAGKLRCSHCQARLLYRNGAVRQTHFAHYSGAACIDRYGEHESALHLALKRRLWQHLRVQYPDAQVAMEVTLATRQRADVLVIWPDGKRTAVEVQVSPLSGEGWLHRHTLYQSIGVDDIWLLHTSRRFIRGAFYTTLQAAFRPLEGQDYLHRCTDLDHALLAHDQALVYIEEAYTPSPTVALSFVTFHCPPSTTHRGSPATTCKTPLDTVAVQGGSLVWPALIAARQEFQQTGSTPQPPDPMLLRGSRTPPPRLKPSPVSDTRHLSAAIEHFHQRVRSLHQHELAYTAQIDQHPLWKKLAQSLGMSSPAALSPVFGARFSFAESLRIGPALWQALLWYRQLNRDRQRIWTASELIKYAQHWLGDVLDDPVPWRIVVVEYLNYLSGLGLVRQDNGWHVGIPIRQSCPCEAWIGIRKSYQDGKTQWALIREVAKTHRVGESDLAWASGVEPLYPPMRMCSDACPRLKHGDVY